MKIQFDNTYAKLPERFFHAQPPKSVRAPAPIRVNHRLADQLGISAEWLESEAGLAVLAGNSVPDGAEPIATVYAAHQFGNWNPQLGDGRALLLGEVLSTAGERFDVQLKGSGPTPYSRGGDGLAPLGPVLREYIMSEAMHALGVPTSRSLAAVATGEHVIRETVQPGAVLTRVASSHIRIGTFQFFAARSDTEALVALADHVIDRHYPEAKKSDQPYRALLGAVIEKTARLVSHWQQVGFIHGVMNTDNMLVCGQTVDYGPCAFMDTYHPEQVFSSIDTGGRYAYQNQPDIAYWNLANFAQCLLPLLDEDEAAAIEIAKAELEKFTAVFYEHHRLGMARKLGLDSASEASDELVRDLLSLMVDEQQDYTLTFSRLGSSLAAGQLTSLPEKFADWFAKWLSQQPDGQVMKAANPVIIPRNHQVEAVIQAALVEDFEPFHELVDALKNPYLAELVDSPYTQPPEAHEVVQNTFCGT
ncbi:MAG: hypothetical protein ACJAXW_003049 [Candidatus Azotimanducaceae bacterium]|jgi:uncharacterized protein YdiU (UPF0061 family)